MGVTDLFSPNAGDGKNSWNFPEFVTRMHGQSRECVATLVGKLSKGRDEMKTAKQIKSALKRSIKKVSTPRPISNNEASQEFLKVRRSLENCMDCVRYIEDAQLRNELNDQFCEFVRLGQQWIDGCSDFNQGALSARVSICDAEKRTVNAGRIWQPI